MSKYDFTLSKFAVAGIALAMLTIADAAEKPDLTKLTEEQRLEGLFRCQVHRGGGSDTRPDNAIESCLWAWNNGLAPEIDARMTKDGVAIAFHDSNLKRIGRGGFDPAITTNHIGSLLWDQIRNADVGSYLSPEYSSYRIATVESVLAEMVGRRDRMLYMDEKGAPPSHLANLAGCLGVIDRVYFCSCSYGALMKWKNVAPEAKGMYWIGHWPPKNMTPEIVADIEKRILVNLSTAERNNYYGVDQVQFHTFVDFNSSAKICPSEDFIRQQVKKLHENGVTVQIFLWRGGKDKKAMRMVWDLGIDNFATDNPVELMEFVKELKAEAAAKKK
jgi:glycerophosphoryl diester phosphodiesterase